MQVVQTPNIKRLSPCLTSSRGIHEKVSGVSAQAKAWKTWTVRWASTRETKRRQQTASGFSTSPTPSGINASLSSTSWAYATTSCGRCLSRSWGEWRGDGGSEEERHLQERRSFGVMVEASNAEVMQSTQERRAKLTFLSSKVQDKTFNQRWSTRCKRKLWALRKTRLIASWIRPPTATRISSLKRIRISKRCFLGECLAKPTSEQRV